jgi:VWFA-related protein
VDEIPSSFKEAIMKRDIRRTPLAALLLFGAAVLSLGLPVLAQDDQVVPGAEVVPQAQSAAPETQAVPETQGRFEGKVDVREVLLDVLVTDRKGNVIVGLDKGDFVVKEDGKPVELTGITFYSNRKLAESQAELTKKGIRVDDVPEDRYFILFYEDQKGKAIDAPQLLTQQILAGRQSRDWIREAVQPHDWVAVVSYDNKLIVHQDFTHDKKLLIAAVDEAIKSKDPGANWPSRVKSDGGPSLVAGLPTGNALRDKTPTIYEAMQVLADAAGKVTGRKNLLLFTGGFGRVDDFGLYTPDPRYYPPTMQTLNDNNVAVYPIDLWPAGTVHELANAMGKLANDTGGKYYFNFTSFTSPMEQVAKENSGYYLLSYRATHPADKSGFQKVEVKTTNPEFRIKAREGYEYGDEG